MPSEGTDARRLSDDVLEVLRLRAIRAREQGYSVEDIATILGVSRETVSRWYSAYFYCIGPRLRHKQFDRMCL
jgi:transposase-like protein